MKRRKMSYGKSRQVFKKKTGIHTMNNVDPRRFRGGIRL